MRRLASILIPSLAVFLTLTAAPAHAANDSKAPEGKGDPVCATLYQRLQPGETESKVLAHMCGESIAEVEPRFAADKLLAVLWEHDEFEGRTALIYGDFLCDSAGYGFSDLTDAHNRTGGITSYALHSGCNQSLLYNSTQYRNLCGGFDFTPVPYIGTSCNDRLFSMRIWKRPCGCLSDTDQNGQHAVRNPE